MKNWLLARALFWGATIAALLLYWLTVPDGLPWNASSHWAVLLTNGTAAEEMPPVSLWSYFVLVFGGHHVALACVAAAFAAGFVAVMAFRIFGWRVAVGAALAWMFAPWVWNRAVTGEWLGFAASGAVFVAWLGVAIAFRATRKARDVWPGEVEDVLWLQLDQTLKPEKTNRLVMWSPVAAGGLFALVSLYVHDYRLGEPASAYARGVVEAAEGRIIVMNGLADDQVVDAAGRDAPLAALSLLDRSDAYRAKVVRQVEAAFPGETNLWVAARIGVRAFAEAGSKEHPERFFAMDGSSMTQESWERRWKAFGPYLGSSDPFVPQGRRAFAAEGNAVANGMTGAAAWQLYRRVFEEVQPGNFSALVNMSEMIRRGHEVSEDERKWLQDALDQFFGDPYRRLHVREIAGASGPIRTDPELVAKLEEEARRRIFARVASEEEEVSPKILSLVEWNNGMVDAIDRGETGVAGILARKILSNAAWRSHPAANAVMGTVAAVEGDYVASAEFFAVATNRADAVPSAVLNDFAHTLMSLGRLDEAERMARRALAAGGEKCWVERLTLADVLVKRRASAITDAEVSALLAEAVRLAPPKVRSRVQARAAEIRKGNGP